MGSFRERRREPRVKVLNLVSVDQRDESGALTELSAGRTLDLSSHGMRVELTRPLPLRSRVQVTVALADRIITLEGQVRHVDQVSDDTCSMGIEFVSLTPEQIEALEEFLQSCG
ncbi:MAG: PilZ domain-containing protein [Deltaproteobacteria bacterium]|jgi:c-di-GMP-binding flagellar brake protein YcgR|nr:PilZ domain-containing protein [Deltaproteobacteria bacterium]MBW2536546.1 PilZ domain-containing protein [Deltaproteobacteria bacterium]